MTTKDTNDLIKLGGLWKNEDKNGNEYFSGNFTYGTKLLILTNTFKEKPNEPDFNIFIAKQEKRQEKKAF
jgi:hypothetical protein